MVTSNSVGSPLKHKHNAVKWKWFKWNLDTKVHRWSMYNDHPWDPKMVVVVGRWPLTDVWLYMWDHCNSWSYFLSLFQNLNEFIFLSLFVFFNFKIHRCQRIYVTYRGIPAFLIFFLIFPTRVFSMCERHWEGEERGRERDRKWEGVREEDWERVKRSSSISWQTHPTEKRLRG